jgi:hypothetical protein
VTLLDANTPRQREGLTLFESLLRQRTEKSDWSPAHYTALAVKASLRSGDTEKAGTLLQLGLRWASDDAQLHYLARVLEREQRGAPQLSSTQ